jgi:hypothetical protein
MEKPFYISQLPEKTQTWIKEKTKENFLKDGMSEEEAEQKASDFLDEKVNVAEDFFGKDFYKSIDAIKDNFTPPGAEDEEEYYEDDGGRVYTWGELKKDIDDWVKKPDFGEQFANEDERKGYFNSDSTPNYRKIYKDFWDIGSNGAMSQISKDRAKELRDDIDTNDNGEIEEDEMADFQKSLDDYAKKNPKGRDDIPVTTRR